MAGTTSDVFRLLFLGSIQWSVFFSARKRPGGKQRVLRNLGYSAHFACESVEYWVHEPSKAMPPALSADRPRIFRITHRDNVPWILKHGLHAPKSRLLDPNFRNRRARSQVAYRSCLQSTREFWQRMRTNGFLSPQDLASSTDISTA